MNKIYTRVWNDSKQCWVVTSELASGRGRPKLSAKKNLQALAMGALILHSMPVMAAVTDINNGNVVSGAVLDDYDRQNVNSGGSATDTTVNSGGAQYVSSGGSATGTTANYLGTQYVSSGGSATSTTLNSGGMQKLVGGSATDTTVNSGGAQYVSSGGSATNTTLNRGHLSVGAGGSVTSTTMNGGQQSVEAGGSATNTIVNSGGSQFVRGSVTSTTLNSGGGQYVNSGGSATDTTVNAGGYQHINSGGSVTSTTVNSGGSQNVSAGGSAIDTTVNEGGTQMVDGSATSTTVNSRGYQNIYSGGSVTDTTVNDGGTQSVFSGGSAIFTTLDGGYQNINLGASATDTTVNTGGAQFIYSGGSATDTTVNDGGWQIISAGGLATSTTVNSGGYQTISAGGSATDTNLNGGSQFVNSGGSATNTTLNMGYQIVSGGSVTDTTVNGGGQNVISGGFATDTTLNSAGFQYISAGGSATSTTVNDRGTQKVNSGGSATNTTINNGGNQVISSGGAATDTTLNSGGYLSVNSGGTALAVTQNAGGALITNTGATVSGSNALGTFSIDGATGSANNVLLENGGQLDVLDSGNATDTTVNNSGILNVLSGGQLSGVTTITDGGTLSGNDIINDGTLNYRQNTSAFYQGNITGTGQLVQDGGSLTLGGTFSQDGGIALNSGGVLTMNNLQATADVAAESGTQLYLTGSTVLTGTVDSADMTVDSASTWNMTGDSQLDSMDHAGTITFSHQSGSYTPQTLTTGDWNGQDGTVVLNTVLGDDTSATDKIVVNGDTSGNTFVKVNNAGGSGAQTIDGILVVDVSGQSDGTFTKSGRIVAGVYDYDLMKKGDDWYLTSQDTTSPVIPDTPATSMVRPESASYTANLAAANTMFITRLHDRLGETQYTDVLTGEKKVTSLWLRQAGGHNSWKDSSGQLSTRSNRYVIQLGGDLAQWSQDGLQRLHLGVMGGYGRNDSNTHSGMTGYRSEGTVSGYSMGLYATWYQNDETKQGMYLDSWAQYSWFDNDVKGQDIQGESYKSRGITASVEAGYTHKLGEFVGSQGLMNEWFIQPQFQAIWMGVEADDHNESNGTRVSGEGDGNLQTRLGVKTYLKGHNKIDEGKNRTFQPFVEVSWIHNTQDFGTRMDGMSMSQNGARNIGEIKTGIEGQLSPQLNLWGNVGVQVGGNGYNDTSAMVGVKYNF